EVKLTATNECGDQTFSIQIGNPTTSLESLHLLTEFSASPNPFYNQTTINYALKETSHNVQLIISDISGRKVEQHALDKNQKKFLLQKQLKKGIYFGQIVVGNERSAVLKLVIL
ncbi:MAG: T9SS type A sorting domain-containing protein, partial [Bacteroidota bacterium]